jgi:transmembrane sensor
MNKNKDTNENFPFLSDWISDKITDNQLRELVNEEDFMAYKKLKKSINSLDLAPPNLDTNFEAIQNKIKEKKNTQKPRVLTLYRNLAIAALFLMFFGVYQLFMFSNEFQTDYGKTAVLNLNDNSQITLNSKSKITYPNFFKFHRNLQLEGEAYFEVAKGKPFVVVTSQGKVRVLGTKFNIIARPDFFEILCFEGKVQVCTKTSKAVITKGMALRFYENKSEHWIFQEEQKPVWISGESSFRQLPLKYVIEQLKQQYNVEIQYPETIAPTKMTGSFTHTNIDVALQSICVPLHLHYKKTASRKIVISE